MKTFQPDSFKEWREWLEKNHEKEKEIWLVYYKKHTKKPTITYAESVEEAICFGWIDGIKRRIDDEKYTHRFTPRKGNSKWSPVNIKIAERMIKSKRMVKRGLVAFDNRKEYDQELLNIRSSISSELTSETKQRLKNNKKAWNNFLKLSPGHRKQYILWLNSAKKEETKERRLIEAVKLLEEDQKLGMK